MADKKTCFIITPIGNNNSEIRRHIDGIIDQAVIPALHDKYEIDVAHRKYEIGSITDRIISSIWSADLVLANLTSLNPNVMFELAIRYSFAKPAIVIAEQGTILPFDVNAENTVFYVNDPAGAADLKETIKKFEESIDYTNNTYGPVFSALKKASFLNQIEEDGSETTEKRFQDYVIERLEEIERTLDKRLVANNYETVKFHVNPSSYVASNYEDIYKDMAEKSELWKQVFKNQNDDN